MTHATIHINDGPVTNDHTNQSRANISKCIAIIACACIFSILASTFLTIGFCYAGPCGSLLENVTSAVVFPMLSIFVIVACIFCFGPKQTMKMFECRD